jgi:putative redox protein
VTSVRHIAYAVASTGSAEPAYRIEIRSGAHHLVGDEPLVAGGADAGPSPFGLMTSALAACTATTLRMYAEHKGWDLTHIDVAVQYDVDDEGQGTLIRTITLPAALTTEQDAGLERMAERTPVTLALRAGTPIATTIHSQ